MILEKSSFLQYHPERAKRVEGSMSKASSFATAQDDTEVLTLSSRWDVIWNVRRNALLTVAGAVGGFLLASAAWADEPPAAKVLTWQDCVTLAARSNPDLLSATRSMEANRALYRGSYNG